MWGGVWGGLGGVRGIEWKVEDRGNINEGGVEAGGAGMGGCSFT